MEFTLAERHLRLDLRFFGYTSVKTGLRRVRDYQMDCLGFGISGQDSSPLFNDQRVFAEGAVVGADYDGIFAG